VTDRESAVERHLIKLVRDRGGLTIKMAPAGQVGVPDRLVLLPGLEPILVELKAEGGHLSPAQQFWHQQAADRGFFTATVFGKVGVQTLMKELDVSERIAKAAGRLSAARRWKGSENAPDEDQARAELAEAKLERAISQNIGDLTPEGRERMARLLDDGDVI
jgi:hypothetical protein